MGFMELTYPRFKVNTLDDNDLARCCPLDNGRHSTNPTFDLGNLDLIPLEVLSMALVQLDLESLTCFRRVNQRAMDVVDSLPQYKIIVTHAPDTLRGALSIGIGRWISCQLLFNKLCTAECEHCGNFGGYIHLMSCKRIWLGCIKSQDTSLPLLKAHAALKFGLDDDMLAQLPHMKSLPGLYSPNGIRCSLKMILFEYQTAQRAAIEAFGSKTAIEKRVSEMKVKRMRQRVTMQAERDFNLPFFGMCLIDWQRVFRQGNPKRWMAVVHAPWWDLEGRCPEWDFTVLAADKGTLSIHFIGE